MYLTDYYSSRNTLQNAKEMLKQFVYDSCKRYLSNVLLE